MFCTFLKLKNVFFLIASSFFMLNLLYAADCVTPRYAPGIVSILNSHEYISKQKALIYWKISPYYISQRNDRSCSLASATMIVNAARSSSLLCANQLLATQDDLLTRVTDEGWSKAVGLNGQGETLDQLKVLLAKALKVYGMHDFTIEAIHIKDSTEGDLSVLRNALIEGETTGQVFIVANFNKEFFCTDAWNGGHFAPVGAYDQQARSVLIMDPDRESYEPYWVPEKLFVDGMATVDSTVKKDRGYLLIKFKPIK